MIEVRVKNRESHCVKSRENPPTSRLGDCGGRTGCRPVGKSESAPTSRLGDLPEAD